MADTAADARSSRHWREAVRWPPATGSTTDRSTCGSSPARSAEAVRSAHRSASDVSLDDLPLLSRARVPVSSEHVERIDPYRSRWRERARPMSPDDGCASRRRASCCGQPSAVRRSSGRRSCCRCSWRSSAWPQTEDSCSALGASFRTSPTRPRGPVPSRSTSGCTARAVDAPSCSTSRRARRVAAELRDGQGAISTSASRSSRSRVRVAGQPRRSDQLPSTRRHRNGPSQRRRYRGSAAWNRARRTITLEEQMDMQ